MDKIKSLYDKYKSGTLSSSERGQLLHHLKASSDDELKDLADHYFHTEISDDHEMYEHKTNKLFDNIRRHTVDHADLDEKPAASLSWSTIGVAAATIVLLGFFALYLALLDKPNKVSLLADLRPGSTKAFLTLENGQTLRLDSTSAEELSGAYQLRRDPDGSTLLVISATPELEYNTITTPRGGEFRILLPDGSEVALNAASSLRYPTRFSNTERRVLLKGEGYFKIAKDAAHPFIVESAGQSVRVLGTEFNINSYQDRVETTLAEGSILLSTAQSSRTLIPGQQATTASGQLQVKNVDLETALSWKHGLMNFKDAELEEVLHEISRWYDVQVIYRTKHPAELFTGGVSRKSNLSAFIKILQLTGVKATLAKQSGKNTLIIE